MDQDLLTRAMEFVPGWVYGVVGTLVLVGRLPGITNVFHAMRWGYDEWKQAALRESLTMSDVFDVWRRIDRSMESIVASGGADRVLLLHATKDADGQWRVTAVRECPRTNVGSVEKRWQNRAVDLWYVNSILVTLLDLPSVKINAGDVPEDTPLALMYEADLIESTTIFRLFSAPNDIWYCSLNRRSTDKMDAVAKETVEVSVDYMRRAVMELAMLPQEPTDTAWGVL